MGDVFRKVRRRAQGTATGALCCREVFKSPSRPPGEGTRREAGLQPLASDECLISLDCQGREKNQGKSSCLCLLHSPHCADSELRGVCLPLPVHFSTVRGEASVSAW